MVIGDMVVSCRGADRDLRPLAGDHTKALNPVIALPTIRFCIW
jgi:hypothetical protein